jgi:hypothetical protein
VELDQVKIRLGNFLKNDSPDIGDVCVICIAGVVAYALCTNLEPFFMEGWHEFRFMTFTDLPPKEHEWRVKYEHLQGEEFEINGNPVCILALKVRTGALPDDDPNIIKPQSWKDMINGDDKKEDDPDGGGCPNQCDSPCT